MPRLFINCSRALLALGGPRNFARARGESRHAPIHESSLPVQRQEDYPMQAAQSVLLIVADDMQPSDIHALRHLHAPPILAETPWQALEHVPIWKFEPADCFNLLLSHV
jgi:hypothetical protein